MNITDKDTFNSIRSGLTPPLLCKNVKETLLAAGRREYVPIPSFDQFNEEIIVFALSYKHASRWNEEGTISEDLAATVQRSMTEIIDIKKKRRVCFWVDQLLHRVLKSDKEWYKIGYLPYALLTTLITYDLGLRESRPWLWAEFNLASFAEEIWGTSSRLAMERRLNAVRGSKIYDTSSVVTHTSNDFQSRWAKALFEVARWAPSKEQQSYPFIKEFEEFSRWAEEELEKVVLGHPLSSINDACLYARPLQLWFAFIEKMGKQGMSVIINKSCTNALLCHKGGAIIGRERWMNIPICLFGRVSEKPGTSITLSAGKFRIHNERTDHGIMTSFTEQGSRGGLDFRADWYWQATPVHELRPFREPRIKFSMKTNRASSSDDENKMERIYGFNRESFPMISVSDWVSASDVSGLNQFINSNSKFIINFSTEKWMAFVEDQWMLSREQLKKVSSFIEEAQNLIPLLHEEQFIAQGGPLSSYLYIGGRVEGKGSFLVYQNTNGSLIMERTMLVRDDVEFEVYNPGLDDSSIHALVALARERYHEVSSVGSGPFLKWAGTADENNTKYKINMANSLVPQCQDCGKYQNLVTAQLFKVHRSADGSLRASGPEEYGCSQNINGKCASLKLVAEQIF